MDKWEKRAEKAKEAIEYLKNVGYTGIKGFIEPNGGITISVHKHKEKKDVMFVFENSANVVVEGVWSVKSMFSVEGINTITEGELCIDITDIHTQAMIISKQVNNTSFYYDKVEGSDGYVAEKFKDESVWDRVRQVLEHDEHGFPVDVKVTTYKGKVIIETIK